MRGSGRGEWMQGMRGMGCEMRAGSWELKLVSSNELRFVATCKTHLF